MSVESKVYTRIIIVAEGKEYECLFDQNHSFSDNLNAFAKLSQSSYLSSTNSNALAVYEMLSGDMIDMSIPLSMLGLQHGMQFMIY